MGPPDISIDGIKKMKITLIILTRMKKAGIIKSVNILWLQAEGEQRTHYVWKRRKANGRCDYNRSNRVGFGRRRLEKSKES